MSERLVAGRGGIGRRAAGVLLATALLVFYAPLLDPSSVLATRDLAELHLPLKSTLAHLAAEGIPQWDPFAHGGQPLLSNPLYGALYPPAWLVSLLPLAIAVNLLVLLHVALAAGGAYRFARRLGAGPGAAVFASLSFCAGPTLLALLHALNIALAMALLPWILEAGFAIFADATGSDSRRAWRALVLSLTALLLLCDPLVVAIAALALLALAAGRPGERIRYLPRLAACGLGALALAAPQVLPALGRLASSPRGSGLAWREATVWSMPWQRAFELLFPRVFGDPTRPERSLYFGWGIHDFDFPFLPWIAIGMPLTLLAIAALLRSGSKERGSWLWMSGCGLFLAFGRHNPLFESVWRLLPGLDRIRFPEKFLLLSLTAWIFAGALEWQALLDERAATPNRSPGEIRNPAALAVLVVALAVIGVAVAALFPSLVDAFVSAHAGGAASPQTLARARNFYGRESWLALAFATGTLLLFLTARSTTVSRRALEVGALLLLALELWTYGRPLLRTAGAREYFAPPAVAGELPPPPARLFSRPPQRGVATEFVATSGDPSLRWARAPIDRLDPRTGNLFGYSYVLDRDFDLSLTRPATRALEVFERVRDDQGLEQALLDAWSVDAVIARRSRAEIGAEVLHFDETVTAPVALVAAEHRRTQLPRVRLIPSASFFAEASEAEAAALAARLPLARREFLIGVRTEGQPSLEEGPAAPFERSSARILGEAGDRLSVACVAERPAVLVVATTFDPGWRAQWGERSLPIYETAAGYMAMVLPVGSGVVELSFSDPWWKVGGALSAATVLAFLLARLRSRRGLESRSTPAAA